MKKQYLLGVDIGTQGIKAGVFNLKGRCLSEGFVKSQLHRPAPDITEEDAEYQLESACKAIKLCIKQSNIPAAQVAALAIDGQMAGVIGIGEHSMAVTPYDSWLDTRCAPYIELMKSQGEDDIIRKTGNPPSFNHGPKILWWKYERPEVYKQIRSFVQPGAYTAMRLCGLKAYQAFIDHTYLHFSGLADNKHSIWDKGLITRFGVDQEKLPLIVKPQKIIGQLTEKMAKQCDLTQDVVVVAGCGDTAASFLACGATEEGICVDVAGTASVFAATVKKFRPDVENKVLGIGKSIVPGLWHPYAYINGGGMNIEWFRKEIAGWKKGRVSTLDKLDKLAEDISYDENIPMFIPHLSGRVSPSQPQLRGAWVGLNWQHGIGHLYKGVLESVALEYCLYVKILRKLYPKQRLKEIRVTGGGQNSKIWNHMKASALATPVVCIKNSVGAPAGSALLAGFGVGLFGNLEEICREWIRTVMPALCVEKEQPYYNTRIKQYEKLLVVMNEYMKNIGVKKT